MRARVNLQSRNCACKNANAVCGKRFETVQIEVSALEKGARWQHAVFTLQAGMGGRTKMQPCVHNQLEQL